MGHDIGDRLTVHGQGHPLSGTYRVENSTGVIPEIANTYVHVRQCSTEALRGYYSMPVPCRDTGRTRRVKDGSLAQQEDPQAEMKEIAARRPPSTFGVAGDPAADPD